MSVRVAIVAGAGGVLGHAATAALATGGLTVVAVDRKEEEMRDLPGPGAAVNVRSRRRPPASGACGSGIVG